MTKDLTREEKLRLIRSHGSSADQLLRILLELQHQSSQQFVDEESASLVAEECGIPLSQIYEALTFYAMLHTKPVARYVIEVCDSAPCHFSHAESAAVLLENILGIQMGGTTPDGSFALRQTTCMGACDRGPVMKIGETVYDRLNEQKIHAILDELRETEQTDGAGGGSNDDA